MSGDESRLFRARGSYVQRCEACQLPATHCICAYRCPVGPVPFELWLLMHPDEARKPTNTGRLITDIIPNARSFTWHRVEPDPELALRLADPAYSPCVVFPAPPERYGDRLLKRWPSYPERTPALILLDGTWQQAGKMFRLTSYLQQLPVLSISPERQSRYQLRRNGQFNQLCTAETGVALLEAGGEPQAATVLDGYFEAFATRYRAARNNHAPGPDTEAMARLRSMVSA